MLRPEKVAELRRYITEQRRLAKRAGSVAREQPERGWVWPFSSAVAGALTAGGATMAAKALHNKASLPHMPDHVFEQAVKSVVKGFGFPAEVTFDSGRPASASPVLDFGSSNGFFRINVPRKAPFEVGHEAGHAANYGLLDKILGGGMARAGNVTDAAARLAPIAGAVWGFGSGYSGSENPWHLFGIPALSNIPRLLNEGLASYNGSKVVNRLGARYLSPKQRIAGKLGLYAQLGSYLGSSALYSLAPGLLGQLVRWAAGRE